MPSLVIKSYTYSKEECILTITFVSGKKYAYFDVQPGLYENFTKAFAKGIYFNKHIKPNRAFIELKADE